MSDLDRAWHDAAEAAVEHDAPRERRACARLVELHELVPEPRSGDDVEADRAR